MLAFVDELKELHVGHRGMCHHCSAHGSVDNISGLSATEAELEQQLLDMTKTVDDLL
jgi:hypothetical protein